MILKRLVAFPESTRILRVHLVATPFLAVETGVILMVPVLLRKHFAAGEWATAAATAALPLMSLLAVFWNEVYCRVSARRYLLILWLVGVLPLAGMALCRTPAMVLAFVTLSACGIGGINPLAADLLRGCYPPVARSRVFGVLKTVEQLTIMLVAFGVGLLLDHNGQAYRVYFPVAVLLIGAGLWLLHRITRQPLFQERARPVAVEPLLSGLRNAYRNLRHVLAGDERFRRFETAFCIYGLGWTICNALLPFLVVDLLRLQYAQVAWSTQVAFQLMILIMLVPAGYLMGRLGPVRMSAWSLAMIIPYPLLLLSADGPLGLARASAIYAIGLSGLSLAWTIGPVTLARNAGQASQYLAMHASLTAVAALVGQFPAVAIYRYSGRIWLPLVLASVLFASGAVLMARVARAGRPPVPAPAVGAARGA